MFDGGVIARVRQFTVRTGNCDRTADAAIINLMVVLRVGSLAVVALWMGGLAALALVAAPAEFLERFRHISWALGGAMLALLAVRALLGPRPRRLAVQVWLVVAMLLASAFVLTHGAMVLTLGAGLAVFWIETKDG